jgi:hypothetical protein
MVIIDANIAIKAILPSPLQGRVQVTHKIESDLHYNFLEDHYAA